MEKSCMSSDANVQSSSLSEQNRSIVLSCGFMGPKLGVNKKDTSREILEVQEDRH